MNVWAVFNTYEIFLGVKNLGPLPSGVSLGDPLFDVSTPRCVSCHTFTEADVTYLESFEGVECMDHMPEDWTYEEC